MKKFVMILLAVMGLLVGCQFKPMVPALTRIAFMTDRDGDFEVYLMDRDGQNLTNLTQNPHNDGVPTWSAQAHAFTFITTREAEGALSIYRMDANGDHQITLSKDVPVDGTPPTWS